MSTLKYGLNVLISLDCKLNPLFEKDSPLSWVKFRYQTMEESFSRLKNLDYIGNILPLVRK